MRKGFPFSTILRCLWPQTFNFVHTYSFNALNQAWTEGLFTDENQAALSGQLDNLADAEALTDIETSDLIFGYDRIL